MAQQQELKESDEQLHWFWKLTTKWWFFPVFYLGIVALLSLISSKGYLSGLGQISIVLIYMPNGLDYWIYLITLKKFAIFGMLDRITNLSDEIILLIIPIVFYLFMLISITSIIYFKNKKNRILKWLILTLLLLIILSFSGCIIGIKSGAWSLKL